MSVARTATRASVELSKVALERDPPGVRDTLRLLRGAEPRRESAWLKASFIVDTFDTQKNKRVPVRYQVVAELKREGNVLQLKDAAAFPLTAKGKVRDLGYRFLPGLPNTLAAGRKLAAWLHREYPGATLLEIHGKRVTEGFKHHPAPSEAAKPETLVERAVEALRPKEIYREEIYRFPLEPRRG